MKKQTIFLSVISMLVACSTAQAGCYAASQELPAAQVASFLANPSAVLRSSPSGGARLITTARDLAATSDTTLAALLALVPSANADQRTALATALAQAARICLRSLPEYAARIQQEIAGLNNPEFAQAFAAASGDLPTGSVGGGAAGGGAGAGAGIGGPLSFTSAATGTSSTSGTSSAFSSANSGTNYFSGVTGSTSPSSSTSTTSTTIITISGGSVSPN